MFMFERMRERIRQQQEEREQRIREERNRLLSLSEKELLVEILMKLKCIEDKIDDEWIVKPYPKGKVFYRFVIWWGMLYIVCHQNLM